MKALELLAQEHRMIERVVNALEVAADALHHGKPVPARFFTEAAEFLLAFADGSHHKKEGVVFRAMIQAGARTEHGQIALLTLEHEEGKGFSRALLECARSRDTDPAAKTALVRQARDYIRHLRGHMQKEDGEFFPSAGAMIPEERHAQVYADCARIEDKDLAGNPFETSAVADRLEREARAFARP
jgi:hemerythrin-like domain-containing protein